MSPRQRRTGTMSRAPRNAGGGSRVAIVLGAIIVGTFIGAIMHAMRGSPHHHEPLDDLYHEYDRAVQDANTNVRALSRELGRVQPEALRRKGVL